MLDHHNDMEDKITNFVWIFTGAYIDTYIGEQKSYTLVEYSVEKGVMLSDFTKKYMPWIKLNDFCVYEQNILNKMLNNGKRFLYKVDDERYGYICNIFDGKYIFTDEENENIKNKLKDLLFYQCVK
jgi:hypothetical protein